MGFISWQDLPTIYNRIQSQAIGSNCSVLIMTAATLDGIAALRILTGLLRNDMIPFKIVPVFGYEDVMNANDNFLQGQQLSSQFRSVIMLDCGATVDLGELLSLSSDITIYIIDSHKPCALSNIFGNTQIVYVDDGFVSENLNKLQRAYEASQYESSESESDNKENESNGKRRKKNNAKMRDDSSDNEMNSLSKNENDKQEIDRDENENEIDSDHDDPRKGKFSVDSAKNAANMRLLMEYYQTGSWYGVSVARLLFNLTDFLNKVNNDHLWYVDYHICRCAIIGVTSQYLLEHNNQQMYYNEIRSLKQACNRLNEEIKAMQDQSNINTDRQIRYEMDYRFMLLRHWSLLSSMIHSRYIATRLSVWKEKGRRLLETFLVKIGIPLSQCIVDYNAMNKSFKDSLHQRLIKYASDFGIKEIYYPSFLREDGPMFRVSAGDTVHALLALLEAPPFMLMEKKSAILSSNQNSNVHSSLNGSNFVNSSLNPKNKPPPLNGSKEWIKNFYACFDALDFRHTDRLKKGIQLAMKQQQIILQEASNILGHRLVRAGRQFRYVVLKSSVIGSGNGIHGNSINGIGMGYCSTLAWFTAHPLSLSKLALFLIDALKSTKKGDQPLVIAVHQSLTNTFIVVATVNGNLMREKGQNPSDSSSSTSNDSSSLPFIASKNFFSSPKNRFGLAFREVTTRIRARVRHDGFETSVIEIKQEDLKLFLHTLQTLSVNN